MSRNLGRIDCDFCGGKVKLTESPREATPADVGRYYETTGGYGLEGMICAAAECEDCEAKYLAWISLTACAGYSRHPESHKIPEGLEFFDLSFRSTFNDEPGEADMPHYRIERVVTVIRHPLRTGEPSP